MEEKRRDSIGTPPPPASTADALTSEQPTSRRRGGAQKRKSASVNSVGSGSTPQTTSSKRQAREKPPPVPFPPIHINGPCTRARVQPYNSNSAYAEVAAVKSEAEAREAAAKVEEMIRANENWQALEAKIEADYAAIRSRDASVHVVPLHAGWFSWKKVHPLEEMMLPSFFNGKLESRTPQIYMDIRNWIMMTFHVNLSEPIEMKHLSEMTVGELNARQEVMEFLEYWGLINFHPFPQHESANMTMDADSNKDEVRKMESLVEKLFKFETVQSWTPVTPRMNTTMPATSSGLFPESVVADELVRSEEPSVEYHCNSCSADCSRKRYHCQKQADFDLCADCFTSGKFDSDMSPSDFILMEPGEAGGAGGGNWTDQETLLLLEAIELFRDNWSEIAEHVATKTRAQCILHFVQMPIEDAFFDHDDEDGDPPKESEVSVSINTENSAPKTDQDSSMTVKEAPQKTESQEATTNNQDSSCPILISKTDEDNALDKSPEAGESLALKALKEALEAVGSFPSPGEKLCFAEVGNPVMALAAYLVRLVDPNVATAAVHSVLKAVSGNSSSEELAARHCFPLEDPPDDIKNLINLEGAATEKNEHEAQNNGKQAENQDETPESVVIVNGSHDETGAKKDSATVESGELVTSEGQKPLSSPSNNHADKSNTMKESGELATHKKAELVSASESISSEFHNQRASKENEDLAVSASITKSQSKGVKESEGGASAGEAAKSNENKKDENMIAASGKMEADSLVKSTAMTEKENLEDDGEDKKCPGEDKETQVTVDNIEFEKLKNAAVAALSGAAVKAKFLADQEEEEILKLTTFVIEKQLYKLETKMAFFQDMENVLMRVKEQLDRSKQKLFHERAQIIATRFGMSGSARPNGPGVPQNRPPFNFPNSAPRPAMGMNSLRTPFPRPMTPSNPTSTTGTAASSVQQPN